MLEDGLVDAKGGFEGGSHKAKHDEVATRRTRDAEVATGQKRFVHGRISADA